MRGSGLERFRVQGWRGSGFRVERFRVRVERFRVQGWRGSGFRVGEVQGSRLGGSNVTNPLPCRRASPCVCIGRSRWLRACGDCDKIGPCFAKIAQAAATGRAEVLAGISPCGELAGQGELARGESVMNGPGNRRSISRRVAAERVGRWAMAMLLALLAWKAWPRAGGRAVAACPPGASCAGCPLLTGCGRTRVKSNPATPERVRRVRP